MPDELEGFNPNVSIYDTSVGDYENVINPDKDED